MSKVFPEAVVELVTSRKRAYQLVLGGDRRLPHLELVLTDLERFCRYRESCLDPRIAPVDPHGRIHAAIEGRREVILRIRDYLDLSVEELCNKYHGDE